MKTHYSLRYRVREFARFWWEEVSWEWFYWVRRLICRMVGHSYDWYTESELDFVGRTYCTRCMAGANGKKIDSDG